MFGPLFVALTVYVIVFPTLTGEFTVWLNATLAVTSELIIEMFRRLSGKIFSATKFCFGCNGLSYNKLP